MKKTAIVHIGLEKTGSTAIQYWLASNRQSLGQSGVLFPQRIGFPNHTKLVAACLDDGVLDNIKSHHLYASGQTETRFRAMVFSELERDIVAAGRGWHTMLITSELISSRLSSHTEIKRLREEIQQYVDHVRFVVFLRRQDQLALSRFSSVLRSGHGEFDAIYSDYSSCNFLKRPDQRPISDAVFFYDFEAIIGRFEGLPHSSLEVFLYGACNPIEVIARLLGSGEAARQGLRARRNQAMCAEAQYILSKLNKIRPVQFISGLRNEGYRNLQRRVESEITGLPRTVMRQSALDFHAGYAEMNQRISRRYGLTDLSFDTDFNMYPEAVDYSALPDSVAAQLLIYQAAAQHLPAREPLDQIVKSKLRAAKASTTWLRQRGHG